MSNIWLPMASCAGGGEEFFKTYRPDDYGRFDKVLADEIEPDSLTLGLDTDSGMWELNLYSGEAELGSLWSCHINQLSSVQTVKSIFDHRGLRSVVEFTLTNTLGTNPLLTIYALLSPYAIALCQDEDVSISIGDVSREGVIAVLEGGHTSSVIPPLVIIGAGNHRVPDLILHKGFVGSQDEISIFTASLTFGGSADSDHAVISAATSIELDAGIAHFQNVFMEAAHNVSTSMETDQIIVGKLQAAVRDGSVKLIARQRFMGDCSVHTPMTYMIPQTQAFRQVRPPVPFNYTERLPNGSFIQASQDILVHSPDTEAGLLDLIAQKVFLAHGNYFGADDPINRKAMASKLRIFGLRIVAKIMRFHAKELDATYLDAAIRIGQDIHSGGGILYAGSTLGFIPVSREMDLSYDVCEIFADELHIQEPKYNAFMTAKPDKALCARGYFDETPIKPFISLRELNKVDTDALRRQHEQAESARLSRLRGGSNFGMSGMGGMQMMAPGRHMQAMNVPSPISFHQNPQAFMQLAFGALNYQLGNRSVGVLPAHFETLNLSLSERLNIGSERLRLEMTATSAAEDARREQLRTGQQSLAPALPIPGVAVVAEGAMATLGTIGEAIMGGLSALLYAPFALLAGDTPIDEHGRALPPPSMRGASDAEEMRQEGIERMVDQFSRSQALPLMPEAARSTAQLIPQRPQFAEMPPADVRVQDLLRMRAPDVRLASGLPVGALGQITFDPEAGRPIIHGTPAEGLRLPQLTGFPIPEQQRSIALITPLPAQERSQVESFPAHDPLGGVTIHTHSRDDSLIDRVAALQIRHEQEEGTAAVVEEEPHRGLRTQDQVPGKLYQYHHILSPYVKEIREHELVKKTGFDIESHVSRMYLPTQEGAKVTTTDRSIHDGRHIGEVHKHLVREMNDAMDQGREEGWTQEQYNAAIKRIVLEERQALRTGDRALNRAHRPKPDGAAQ